MKTSGKSVLKGLGFCATGIGSNTVFVDVDENNEKIIRIRPMHWDEIGGTEDLNPWVIEGRNGAVLTPGDKTMMSSYSLVYKNRVYSKNRILKPMKRVDWDPDGERNPQNRGKSGYVEISWDEALDIIANEMKRVIEKYGMTAILHQGDGHGESKIVHGTHGGPQRLLSKISDGNYTYQCRQPDSWEGWYWGAKHIWGQDPFGYQMLQNNQVMGIAQHGDAVLFWGADPETTPLTMGTNQGCRVEYFWHECGVKQIHIAPDCNYSNMAHADKWIPVLPNTDSALHLAIAYVWLTEGTYDAEYLETHAIGFENWAYYVMGGEDGIPKTPKWAEKKCGVPAHTIKALARYWAKHNVSIAHIAGGGLIRSAFSHEPGRLEVALLGMQALGAPGRNQVLFSGWSLFGSKTISPMPGGEEIPNLAPAYRGRENICTKSQIPKTMIPQAMMLGPGERISWYSHVACGLPREDQFTGPFHFPIEGGSTIHMIWSDAPCWSTCWNGGNEWEDALRHENVEFVMIQHQWFENDMNFADLCLPVNTKLEEFDVSFDGETGQYNLVYYEPLAIKPLGESYSDTEIIEMVAKRLDQEGGIFEGIYEKYTEGKTLDDWCRAGFENTEAKNQMTYEEFKEGKVHRIPTRKNWQDEPIGLQGFYENPEKYKLATPSGKLEYYSTALAQTFPDDEIRGPIPRWIEKGDGHDDRIDSERALKYPFLIVSNHPRWRMHAQFDDAIWFREVQTSKVVGPDGYAYEPVWINPKDAAKIGVQTGDVVDVFNERGHVLGGAYVTERIMPGVVYQDHGARVDTVVPGVGGIDRGGANNLIAPSAVTSKNCVGEVTAGYLVGVNKVDPFKLAEEHPVPFSKAYDPDCGLTINSRMA